MMDDWFASGLVFHGFGSLALFAAGLGTALGLLVGRSFVISTSVDDDISSVAGSADALALALGFDFAEDFGGASALALALAVLFLGAMSD